MATPALATLCKRGHVRTGECRLCTRDRNAARSKESHIAYNHTLRGRFAQLLRSAKRNSRTINLTFGDYTALVQSGVCYYCGSNLPNSGHGVDRLDHREGYVTGNVVPCCGFKNGRRGNSCNTRKGCLEGAGFTYPRTVELLKELLEVENGD
jgi:hypothetical protein